MNRDEIIWAAGFFDGEGYCGLSKGCPRITIGQKRPEVLRRFRRAIGGLGRINDNYVNGRAYYKLEIGAMDDVERVCAMLLPFLSPVKRAQIAKVYGARAELLASGTISARGSDEWKAKVYTPERAAKISAALKGRPKSEAHRAAISAARKGKNLSDARLDTRKGATSCG